MNINLQEYGLNEMIAQEASQYRDLYMARIIAQYREIYRLVSAQGEIEGTVGGKLAYEAQGTEDFPTVGDWVLLDREHDRDGIAIIRHLLSRKSVLARQMAGAESAQQLIAANLDTIFICMSLNEDFNLRRLERYLTIAWDSQARPVIVLTKADLCENLPQCLAQVGEVGIGVEVLSCSSMSQDGYRAIEAYLQPGRTVAFIGSSGVGKSTLINRLAGRELLATQEIRHKDGRGRHTTSHRQLLLLPGGAMVIDTPGMRELQLSGGDLSKSFADIEELAAACKFHDCAHGQEPGCMVRQAIAEGRLSEERFASYLKLQRELAYGGLNARQLENEKINHMFGSKKEMKQLLEAVKHKRQG